jgi:limonene-1,2-epoxide hydrolase
MVLKESELPSYTRPEWTKQLDAEPANANEKLVLDFLNAFGDLDASNFGPHVDKYFAEDGRYDNMPQCLPLAVGLEQVKASLGSFFSLFTMHIHTFAIASSKAGVVMTERVDRLTHLESKKTYDLLLMGVFECANGKITYWRCASVRLLS